MQTTRPKSRLTHSIAKATVRCVLTALLALAGTAGCNRTPRASAPAPSPLDPTANGIVAAPAKGSLREIENDEFTVTFPTLMVEEHAVGWPAQVSPIVFEPALDAEVVWTSQASCKVHPSGGMAVLRFEWQASHLRPITYRARLREDLRDLEGKPVNAQHWGAEFASDTFALTDIEFVTGPVTDAQLDEIGEPRTLETRIGPRPRVRLSFSRDVAPRAIANAAYFQDAETHQRYPVEAALQEPQRDAPQGWLLVEPRAPLPGNRSFYFVLDRIAEDRHGDRLAHLRVAVAGFTEPLAIESIAGFHQPQRGVFIRVECNQPLDPALRAADFVSVTPPVPESTMLIDGARIEIEGKLDLATVYRVEVKAGLKSADGFALEKGSSWRARFPHKRPAIIMPEERIAQRMATGIRYEFTQVNTDPLDWKLVEIPAEKLVEVLKRLREFSEYEDEEKTQHVATEPLIPALELGNRLVDSGRFPRSAGNVETVRRIEWRPSNPQRKAGLFLLEVTGKSLDGRAVGNRTLISCGEWTITRKRTPTQTIVRLTSIADGLPAAAVRVEMRDETGSLLAQGRTNGNGELSFEKSGEYLLAGEPGAQFLQKSFPASFPSGDSDQSDDAKDRTTIVLERDVYRPGETVHFKGFRRLRIGEKLALPSQITPLTTPRDEPLLPARPAGRSTAPDAPAEEPEEEDTAPAESAEAEPETWAIRKSAGGRDFDLHFAAVELTEFGSWTGEWKIPDTASGEYTVEAFDVSASFLVEEYRAPAFSVVATAEAGQGETAQLKVSSRYFHGSPNANAKLRWRAEWLPVRSWTEGLPSEVGVGYEEDEFTEDGPTSGYSFTDEHSPDGPTRGISEEVQSELAKAGWETPLGPQAIEISKAVPGEAQLDADGQIVLECKSPFPPSFRHGRAKIYWTVDVTAADGQTLRGGTIAEQQMPRHVLGTTLTWVTEEEVELQVASFDLRDEPTTGVTTHAVIQQVEMNTVKEKLDKHLYRYRNSPVFTKAWEGNLTTPARQRIKLPSAGEYIVTVRSTAEIAPQVSDRLFVEGEEYVDFEIDNEHALEVAADRPAYQVGETAMLTVRAAFAGIAYLTVETDRVLHRQVVPMKGNTARIELQIKPEYFPNAHVCVHVIKPGGAAGVPDERFGHCEIAVTDPAVQLQVIPEVPRDAKPGDVVSVEATVRSGGKPVADAEVLVFAVDEAVLQLGDWTLPDLPAAFFPKRPFAVKTSTALGEFQEREKSSSLHHHQKGFILGDAGAGFPGGQFFRDERHTLAFWQPSLRSDAQGRVRGISFKVPRNFTSYRVVAVAQTRQHQFGAGETSLRIAQPVQAEPALPRFTRAGDEFDLRVVTTQSHAASDRIAVRLELPRDGAIELLGADRQEVTVLRDQPKAVRFKVRIRPGSAEGATPLIVSAQSLGNAALQDRAQKSLRVLPPNIIRRQTLAEALPAPGRLDVPAKIPAAWAGENARCDVIVSGSPWVAKLAGMPAMLEAHGSLEKTASQMLAATLLAEMLDFLPEDASAPAETSRKAQLSSTIAFSLKRISEAAGKTGMLPNWPSSQEISLYATTQAAWAVLAAQESGEAIPPRLDERMLAGLNRIISNDASPAPSDFERCFALMVASWATEEARARRHPDAETPPPAPAVPQHGEFRIHDAAALISEADLLYHNRDTMDAECKAMLALAMHHLAALREEKGQLLAEIDQPISDRAFDPARFGAGTRAEAIRLLARAEIGAAAGSEPQRRAARESLERLVGSSVDLSTQENLWLLLAFQSVHRGERPAVLRGRPIAPKPAAASPNGVSVGWLNEPLSTLRQKFAKPLQSGVAGSYLIRASFQAPAASEAAGNGLHLARQVRNCTDAARTGAAAAPFKIGDLLQLTYTLDAKATHHYLEFEDQLPACLESIDHRLPIVRRYYQFPRDPGLNTAALLHLEQDDSRTRLYIQTANPGTNTCTLLARVTMAGVFRWPAAQVTPMYDSRFYAVTPSSNVVATD